MNVEIGCKLKYIHGYELKYRYYLCSIFCNNETNSMQYINISEMVNAPRDTTCLVNPHNF